VSLDTLFYFNFTVRAYTALADMPWFVIHHTYE